MKSNFNRIALFEQKLNDFPGLISEPGKGAFEGEDPEMEESLQRRQEIIEGDQAEYTFSLFGQLGFLDTISEKSSDVVSSSLRGLDDASSTSDEQGDSTWRDLIDEDFDEEIGNLLPWSSSIDLSGWIYDEIFPTLEKKAESERMPKGLEHLNGADEISIYRALVQLALYTWDLLTGPNVGPWMNGVFGIDTSSKVTYPQGNQFPFEYHVTIGMGSSQTFVLTHQQFFDVVATYIKKSLTNTSLESESVDKSKTVGKAVRTLFEGYGFNLDLGLGQSILEFERKVSILYFLGIAEKYLKYVFSAAFCFLEDQGEFPKPPAFLAGKHIPGIFLGGAGYKVLHNIRHKIREGSFVHHSKALSILMLKYGCPYPDSQFLDEGIMDHYKGVCRDSMEDTTFEYMNRRLPKMGYFEKTITPMSSEKRSDIEQVMLELGRTPFMRDRDKKHTFAGFTPGRVLGLDELANETWEEGSLFNIEEKNPVFRLVENNLCAPAGVSPSCSSHTLSRDAFLRCSRLGLEFCRGIREKGKLSIRHGGSFYAVSHLLARLYEPPENIFYRPCEESGRNLVTWDEECIQYTHDDWIKEFGTLHESSFVTPFPLRDPIPVRPVPLPEELKVRVVTLGSSLEYHSMMDIQRLVHGRLRRLKPFRLIGEMVTSSLIEDIFPVVPLGAFFVSGDYKAATDNLQPELSMEAALLVCEAFHMDEDQKSLFLYGLCGHEVNYNGAVSGLVPSSRNWVKSHELVRKQTHGQLMGSPVSFPILCLVNDACLRTAVREYLKLVTSSPIELNLDNKLDPLRDTPAFINYCRGILGGEGYLINGDDILFLGTPCLYDIWTRIVRSAGLEPSVGKNYTSDRFCIVNSTMFLYQQSQEDIGCTFTQVPWMNQSLLNNGVREKPVILTFSNDPTLKSIGSNGHEFLRGVPPGALIGSDLWVDKWNSIYVGSWKQHLEEMVPQGLPWFAAALNGGLGLPITREVSLSSNQVKYLEYFSQNVAPILNLSSYDRVKDAGVQSFVPNEDTTEVGVLETLPSDGGRSALIREGYRRLYDWINTPEPDVNSAWEAIQIKYRRLWFSKLSPFMKEYVLEKFRKENELGSIPIDQLRQSYFVGIDNRRGTVLEEDVARLDDVVVKEVQKRMMKQFPALWRSAQQHTIKDKALSKWLTYDDQLKNYKIKNKNGQVCPVMWSMPIR